MFKKLPKQIAVSHIYDTPEIYQLIYSRPKFYKYAEAEAFAHILEKVHPKCKSILEMLSGAVSEHKQFFKSNYSFTEQNKLEYFCTDGSKSTSKNIIQIRDIAYGDFGRKFDAVIAFFYSANSIIDYGTGLITTSHTIDTYKNIYKHLNKKGVFVIDSAIDGYRVALQSYVDNIDIFPADYKSKLSNLLRNTYGIKITPQDELYLRTKVRNIYDRMNCNNMDYYKYIEVVFNEEVLTTYTVQLPFCIRYFSEFEMVEMLKNAGFKEIQFWSCNYEEADYKLLENKVYLYDLDKDEDDVEDLMPNVYVAIK